ncbi:DUF4395 domain-containing protein [Jatrophihabitans endophyticus]|uniref:DUF4395 domain-containing protein n=1 Tax=Jatrophihabitans endophyticus TaxID=1206085 RepID=UPI0019F8DFC4|nr:DUF4395 domain-containing protein [Jatrophihabitans endophyticus]MBE7186674.1 DUF4395 domain-containing protein [Jatrophihabitans endophyticus]
MASVIGFPNPVNEVAARAVAGGVVVLSALTLVLGLALDHAWYWLTVLLAAGFVARVVSGPTLSPLGQVATRVVAPRIGHEKLVPGPPKRFAQAIGATLTVAAVVLTALSIDTGVVVLLAMLLVAATLESVFGLCLGCKAFAVLMRAGVIPPETCEACANIGLRAA